MVHNGGVSDHSYVADDPVMEYLDTGAPAPGPAHRRRARPWAPVVGGVAVFLVALLVIGAVAGDWAMRTVEMRGLLTRIEASEAAMASTQDAVQAAFDEFTALQSPTADDEAALKEAVQAAAATGLESVTEAGAGVAAVKVLPWHTTVAEAQTAYVAHNKAWQDYLSRASADAQVLAQPADVVNETFAAAEAPLRAAVPRPDALRMERRIDVIYAPPPMSGDGQQA